MDVFGLTNLDENENLDFLRDTPPSAEETGEPEQLQLPLEYPEEEPASEQAEQEPVVTAEEPQEAEPETEEPVVEEPEEVSVEEHRWAGKYTSAEELEKGYKELRDLQRRTAERAKAAERQRLMVEQKALELQKTLQEAVPAIQQYMQQQQKPVAADGEQQWPWEENTALTPAQVKPLIDQVIQTRLMEAEQQRNQQSAEEQAARAASDALSQFFSAHPEIEPDSEEDSRIAETIVTLHKSWESEGWTLDLTDSGNYEIAYEASQRPALQKVLELNPSYVESEDGMLLARAQAEILESRLTQEKPKPTTQQRRVPTKPVAEKATGAAPPKDERPLDEFDAAVLALRNERTQKGSIFF
jgi:hypothetical protein